MTDEPSNPQDDEDCPPLTPTELDHQVVKTTAEEVERYGKWASRIEIMLVGVAALAFVIAAAFGGYSIVKLKELAEANKQRALAAQAGQQFAIDAVNCIRYVLIEHRYVNQEYHDALLLHFGVKIDVPVHPDLPRRPTPEQIALACKSFEDNPQPPTPPTTEGGRK